MEKLKCRYCDWICTSLECKSEMRINKNYDRSSYTVTLLLCPKCGSRSPEKINNNK